MTNDDNRNNNPDRLNDEYDDSVDFATTPGESDSSETVIIDSDKLAELEMYRSDNLPSDELDGDHWVSRHRYNRLYDEHLSSEEAKAVYERNYEKAYQQNTILRNENDRLVQEVNEYKSDNRAVSTYNKDFEAELQQREADLAAAEGRFRPKKIAMGVVTGVSLIVALTFMLMWMDLKNDESSIGQRDAAQQEQVRGLRTSLEQEKEDHESTRSELDSVNTRMEELTGEMSTLRDENRDLQATIDNRDSDIEQLNSDIDQLRSQNEELSNRAPETVTRTFVQQQPGETQTETRTVTQTETTTVESDSR